MAMPRLIKIGVTGCAGRMGAAIVQLIIEDEECTLAGGIERFENEIIGQDIGDVYNMGFIGHKVEHDAEHLFKVSDVILDFTSPEATVYHAELAATILEPFVSEENYWIVKHHGIFQGYYFFEFLGLDKNMRDKYSESPYFESCKEFCEKYDQNSFDPEYDAFDLDFFVPMVKELFKKPKKSIYLQS